MLITLASWQWPLSLWARIYFLGVCLELSDKNTSCFYPCSSNHSTDCCIAGCHRFCASGSMSYGSYDHFAHSGYLSQQCEDNWIVHCCCYVGCLCSELILPTDEAVDTQRCLSCFCLVVFRVLEREPGEDWLEALHYPSISQGRGLML
jgi:hypothetical protein